MKGSTPKISDNAQLFFYFTVPLTLQKGLRLGWVPTNQMSITLYTYKNSTYCKIPLNHLCLTLKAQWFSFLLLACIAITWFISQIKLFIFSSVISSLFMLLEVQRTACPKHIHGVCPIRWLEKEWPKSKVVQIHKYSKNNVCNFPISCPRIVMCSSSRF